MALQHSALHTIAAAAGSKFLERHGWEMPAAYADPTSEYQSVITGAALYDASHMGRLRATGDDVLDLLNRLSTNKVVDLEPGQGAPTILTTDKGRILDVITVAHAGDHLLLLTSPGTQDAVIQFLDKYTIMEDMTVEDVSAATTMLALWGPRAGETLETTTKTSGADAVGALPPYHTLATRVGECQVRVVAYPMSELPGYYVVCANADAEAVWQQLTGAGATPIGAEAYETARISIGVPAHGPEMGEEYNPLEAGLIGSIDFTKGCYIGQEVIARLDSYHKVQKYLVKLEFGPGSVVAPGAILTLDSKPVGKVTSVTSVPPTGRIVGLAYVRTQHAEIGARLELAAPGEGWAEVQGLPQMFGPGQG